MANSFPVILGFVFMVSASLGEVAVEFDGKEWVLPEGVDELNEKTLKDGVCFTADAGVPCGVALEGMGLEQLLSHPVRFALRSQEGRGAALDPIPPGKLEADNVIAIVCDKEKVMTFYHPGDAFANTIPDNTGRAVMGYDFEGLQGFLDAVKIGVKKSEAKDQVPRAVLVVRSDTSFGTMVRLLQLVRSAGCESGLVRVDDDISRLHIDVLADRGVDLPVVKSPQKEPSGRIVLNIRMDGTVNVGENIILAGKEDVFDYVKLHKEQLEADGLVAKLHLRGDKESVFKHSREVIRWAAEAGVDQVIFAVYEIEKPKERDAARWREQDLKMELPATGDAFPGGENKAPIEVGIKVDEKGRLSISGEEGFLDTDATKRELPLLNSKLDGIAIGKGRLAKDLKVSLNIDPLASQQRVIDVLNALAGLEITKVTLIDPDGE